MTNASRFLFVAFAAAACVLAGGCRYLRQDMANQPKNLPLSPSDFFGDGRSERPLLDNTVARGSIAEMQTGEGKTLAAFLCLKIRTLFRCL